jgi:hypothetical protein
MNVGPWLIEVHDRSELEPWLAGGPPARATSSVMLVRGDGPVVRVFLPNALDAAKQSERRVVVWTKDPTLLDDGPISEAFNDGSSVVAVVLGADGSVGAWVNGDRIGVDDAAFAFRQAEMIHA